MPGPFDDIKTYARSRGYSLAGMDSPLASLLSLIGRVGTATTPASTGGGGTTGNQSSDTQSANNSGDANTATTTTGGNASNDVNGNDANGANAASETEVTITVLKRGDKDATHLWNGQSYPDHTGTYVKDLQERLLELGYWVSSPSSSNGRLCDGDYGVTTEGGVALFQIEHMAINTDGTIDETKVSGVYDTETITAMAAASTTRPSHKARNLTGDVQFVQLPPSENYTRYLEQFDDNSNFKVLTGTNYHFMTDNWARSETVDLIRSVSTEWKNKGKQQFLIGDLSLFHGGSMAPHSTHKNGYSADIDHATYCSIDSSSFDPVQALDLVDLFKTEGAEKMYINCHHVIRKNNKTEWCSGHHHHLHVYLTAPAPSRKKTSCGQCAKYATCDYKILKVSKKNVDNSEETYNPLTTYNGESKPGLVYRIKSASGASTGDYYVSETNSPD